MNMQIKHLFRAGLAGALVFIAQTTTAQGWQTVDDFQYAADDAANTGLDRLN